MSFSNATPYPGLDVPLIDFDGREVITAILKATFEILEDGRIVPAEEPSPIRVNDEPYDADNPHGSVRYASDLCLEKVGTDVIVVGEAISRVPVKAMDVAVKVGTTTAPLRVHGERMFYRGLLDVAIGPAAPFERKAIVYEKAYGGVTSDSTIVELRNWAGVGVYKSKGDLVGTPAPQIEHPAHPHTGAGDKHPPVGFGAIMTHWSPRREFAGTFDELWQKTRMPLVPLDFDLRYNNVAHPSLRFDQGLSAGEPIAVVGMAESGTVSFLLPRLPIVIRGIFEESGKVEARPPIDTLLIEPDLRRFELTVRKSFPVGRGKDILREIRVDIDL